MAARFFVDENDLALGKALAAEHDDVVYPGHPDLPEVPRGALDDEWLPMIGQLRLVVITRDRRIRYRPAEKLGGARAGPRSGHGSLVGSGRDEVDRSPLTEPDAEPGGLVPTAAD